MDNSGKLLGAQINLEWFLYQEKEVFGEYRQKRLTIGLPNETERRENRVCLTPEAVAMMVDMGHTIMVQRGAGEAAHYHDREYADAGAQMLDTCEEVYTADIILKPTPVMQADVEMMHDRQVILSPIELFELRKEASQQSLRHFQQLFPSLLTLGGIILLAGGETILETIRGNKIHLLTQEMLTFFRSNVTDRRETIRPFCRLTFQGLFGIHAETMSRFHWIVILHRIIKRQAVPGNTTS